MITMEFSDGSTVDYMLVKVDMQRVQYDSQTYRGATAEQWLPMGTDRVDQVATRLRFEVPWPDDVVQYQGNDVSFRGNLVTFDVATASATLDELLSNIRSAVLLSTPYGTWRVAGVTSVVEQPAGLGYVATVGVSLLNPRFDDAGSVLRLQDGTIWELR